MINMLLKRQIKLDNGRAGLSSSVC
jgi:hypothetical protein